MIQSYLLHLLIVIGIYSILVLSLNLAMGFTGLLNIGHVAFYGIGAYTSALLSVHLGFPFWFSIIFAGLVAGLFGLILAFPTLKLKGDYLALATLGFVVIIESVFRNWTSLTNGPMGVSNIPKPSLFGFEFSSMFSYLVLVIFFVIATYLIFEKITKAPFGNVLKAIREDETVIETLGKNIFEYKTIVLIISAFFAGIAGSLYAHYITFIDPSSFSILGSILIISMLIIGGLANNKGAMLGALIIILIQEPLRFLDLPSSVVGALRQMIYALIIIYLVIKRPQGIMGEFKKNAA